MRTFFRTNYLKLKIQKKPKEDNTKTRTNHLIYRIRRTQTKMMKQMKRMMMQIIFVQIKINKFKTEIILLN